MAQRPSASRDAMAGSPTLNAAAGAVAGSLVVTVMFPVDLSKTLMQARQAPAHGTRRRSARSCCRVLCCACEGLALAGGTGRGAHIVALAASLTQHSAVVSPASRHTGRRVPQLERYSTQLAGGGCGGGGAAPGAHQTVANLPFLVSSVYEKNIATLNWFCGL